MKKKVVLSDTREIPLLMFLWKWKVSTTAALIQKFFQNCSGKTAYNRILALRQAGLVRVRADGQGQKFLCTLDREGFNTIKERLPYIKEDGFKSENLGHDLVVSAFHLGHWLMESPKDAALFSEQELRRTDMEFYPDWIPRTDIHRPDGYSLVPFEGGLETFAFEVELHYKRDTDYLRVAEFYEHYTNIKRVLWLVPKGGMAESLNQKMIEPLRSQSSPHNFITLEEFKLLGWESRIVIGPDKGLPLSKLLPEIPQKAGVNLPDSSPVLSLLDTRKSPHVATTYRGYGFGDFAD